jgi:hypothetical protein
MMLPQLPTVWRVYNLRGSPFFQETLQHGHDRRTLDLFVGRDAELRQLHEYIRGRDSSRQAVAGPSGIGKTTLVQRLKFAALAEGYFTRDDLVPFLAGDTPESFFARALSEVFAIILANRPQSGGHEAMQEAEQTVRAIRLSTGGASLSLLGAGGGFSRGVSLSTPKDILVHGPHILANMLAMVRDSGESRGVVLHLNNLENLSGSDLQRAATTLQSLRDILLMLDGLHVVLVGTTDAVHHVVNANAQVRNVFRAPLVLESLALPQVCDLLSARYDKWRLDESFPARAPVEQEVIERLWSVFRGDLRGLLKALDDGVEECIGLRVVPAGEGSVVAPVALGELGAVLQHRYTAVMREELEAGRIDQLEAWVTSAPDEPHTQKALMSTWELSQGAVSNAVNEFIARGYVLALARGRNQATQYLLTGKSRVIAGLVHEPAA